MVSNELPRCPSKEIRREIETEATESHTERGQGVPEYKDLQEQKEMNIDIEDRNF